MLEYLITTFGLINPRIFLFSVLIFIIGYAFAPTAYYKKINLLVVYPLWLSKKLEVLAQKNWNPFLLFLFLLTMNSLSLFLSLLSGLVPLLPFLFVVWTGLNIGVITYHTLKGRIYYASLLNPVALFELPAAFLTFTLAIQYNIQLLMVTFIEVPRVEFQAYIQIFVWLLIPLLIIAAILESALIRLARKLKTDEDNEDNKTNQDQY